MNDSAVPVKRRLGRRAVLGAALLLALGTPAFVPLAGPARAVGITITRSELNADQLRVEGNGALPNHAISINPGAIAATTDGVGAFKVQSSPYSSSTCQVTVSDDTNSASAVLVGCTPTSTPPPAPAPAPAPVVSVTPSTLSFPTQLVGSTSAAGTVTVSNSGNASLSVSTAVLGGTNPGDYAKLTDGCSNATVSAGSGCTVSVTFSPSLAGTRAATLTITDNAAGSPRTVTITGTGASATPASAPAVTFSPTSMTFPAQTVGTTSGAQTVTVTNSGTAGLFINSAATRGANPLDFTQVSDGCSGVTLAPGTGCTVSITFAPTASGTRSGTFLLTDNATASPQSVPLTGTGTGTTPPPTVNTQFMTCANGVCDIGAGSNVFVNNYYSTNFIASGGTAPYTWTIIAGVVPVGLNLTPAGLLSGTPTTIGTSSFTAKVTDASGSSASQPLSLTVTGPPPPSPPGCQSGRTVTEPLSGPLLNGQTPGGEALADESQLTACGGFTLLSVNVNNVNVPDGTTLWVSFDFKPVGTITVSAGSGAMNLYNLGNFGPSFDHIHIVNHAPPRVNGEPEVLTGGFFS